MRYIIIGDIHGCYYTLISLINKIKINKNSDKLIFLGDYIDRGKNSFQVVEYLIKLQKEMTKERCICLKGNHEDMFLTDEVLWKYNGGNKTRSSYYANNHIQYLYNSHKSWMSKLPHYYETDNFICVHAGLPKAKLEDNTKDDMLWNRTHITNRINRDKQVIFGHTPSTKLEYKTINNDICIDTACVFGYQLTALIIDENNQYSYIYEDKNIKD